MQKEEQLFPSVYSSTFFLSSSLHTLWMWLPWKSPPLLAESTPAVPQNREMELESDNRRVAGSEIRQHKGLPELLFALLHDTRFFLRSRRQTCLWVGYKPHKGELRWMAKRKMYQVDSPERRHVEVCRRARPMSNSNIWRKFRWKAMMRYFRTPQITGRWKVLTT